MNSLLHFRKSKKRSLAGFAAVLLAGSALVWVAPGHAGTPINLKVGSLNALSGEAASYGKSEDFAVRMAAKFIEESAKKAGMDATVQVFSEDTQSRGATSAEAMTKLAQVDGVDVVVGPASTGETVPAFQAACLPNDIPMFTMATSPAIAKVDSHGYLFAAAPSDVFEAKILVKLAQQDLGATKTINVGALNNAPGTAFSSNSIAGWRAGGGQIGQSVMWNPDQPTFETEAQKLASGDPAGWIIYDFPGSWQKFLPALVRTGKWDPARTFGGDPLGDMGAEVNQKLGKAMAGLKYLNIGAKAGPTLDDFNKLWTSSTNLDQVYGEAQAFDSTIIAFLAAVKAGSTKGKDIAANVRAVSGPDGTRYNWEQLPEAIAALQKGESIHYIGASGEFDFDEHGSISSAFYTIFQWTADGKQKMIGSVGQ